MGGQLPTFQYQASVQADNSLTILLLSLLPHCSAQYVQPSVKAFLLGSLCHSAHCDPASRHLLQLRCKAVTSNRLLFQLGTMAWVGNLSNAHPLFILAPTLKSPHQTHTEQFLHSLKDLASGSLGKKNIYNRKKKKKKYGICNTHGAGAVPSWRTKFPLELKSFNMSRIVHPHTLS